MYDVSDSKLKTWVGKGGEEKSRIVFRIICDDCGEKQGYGIKRSKPNFCKGCQYRKLSEENFEGIEGNCESCGKLIRRPKSQWDRAEAHVCSVECGGKVKRKNIGEVKRHRLKAKMLQAGVAPMCVRCGHANLWNLQAHHIVFVSNSGSNELSNLEFQCRNCHGDTHHFAGKDLGECRH
jgi:RNase P protein component